MQKMAESVQLSQTLDLTQKNWRKTQNFGESIDGIPTETLSIAPELKVTLKKFTKYYFLQ